MRLHSWLKKLRQWVVLPKSNRRRISFFVEVRGRGFSPIPYAVLFDCAFFLGLSMYSERVIQ